MRRFMSQDGSRWQSAQDAVPAGQYTKLAGSFEVPPAGFEPALTAPEAVALSPELRGLQDSVRLPVRMGLPRSQRRRGYRPGNCPFRPGTTERTSTFRARAVAGT